MIDIIDKIIGLLIKPLVFAFRYLRDRPIITVSLEGDKALQANSVVPDCIHLKWWRTLVFHNDSPNLIRGIKLLSGLPKGWRIHESLPTRLNADERIELKMEIEAHLNHQDLLDRHGVHFRGGLAKVSFPDVIDGVIFDFEVKNERGRTFYQTCIFRRIGAVASTISTKRPR